MTDGIRWSVGASHNDVHDNLMDITGGGDDAKYAAYMCEYSPPPPPSPRPSRWPSASPEDISW